MQQKDRFQTKLYLLLKKRKSCRMIRKKKRIMILDGQDVAVLLYGREN